MDGSSLIEQARAASGLSRRRLAHAAGISQSTLSRIIAGDRVATMPEIVMIAQATGQTVAQLTGTSTVAGRVQCATSRANSSGTDGMRDALLRFLELDDYLDCHAVPPGI